MATQTVQTMQGKDPYADLSCSMNMQNTSFVQSQINQKICSTPYYGTVKTARGVTTDYDNFPYKRYYRGYWDSSAPIIAEREAGFRPRMDSCYKPNNYKTDPFCTPNLCFNTAPTTVLPCRPEYVKRYGDKEELDLFLDTGCIIQYR